MFKEYSRKYIEECFRYKNHKTPLDVLQNGKVPLNLLRKYSSVIQILPLHKPQKNEKKELRITHTYGIKISVIM